METVTPTDTERSATLVQTARLRQEMAARGMTTEQVAWQLGMSEKCLVRKLESGRFGCDEMLGLTAVLQLRYPEEIFFAKG